MSRRYIKLVFLNPVTPSGIVTSLISKSQKVRFTIVWSRLNYFTVHSPGLRLHIPYTCSPPTPCIDSILNWRHILSPVEPFRRNLFAEIVNVLKPLVIFVGELHQGYLTGFEFWLCLITYYSWKVWGEAFQHWDYTRES